MTIMAVTMVMPHPGKRGVVQSRARQLGDIYARHGAKTKLAGVISGPNTGAIALLRAYADFRAANKAFAAANDDPAHGEWWGEVEANPAANIIFSRNILRSIYGENQWDTHPVSLIRRYDLSRDKVSGAVQLMGEVSAVVAKADVNVVGLLPVTGDDMSSGHVSYQFRSLDHFAEAFDTVGTSEEFQSLIAKAASLGTLRAAFLLTAL